MKKTLNKYIYNAIKTTSSYLLGSCLFISSVNATPLTEDEISSGQQAAAVYGFEHISNTAIRNLTNEMQSFREVLYKPTEPLKTSQVLEIYGILKRTISPVDPAKIVEGFFSNLDQDEEKEIVEFKDAWIVISGSQLEEQILSYHVLTYLSVRDLARIMSYNKSLLAPCVLRTVISTGHTMHLGLLDSIDKREIFTEILCETFLSESNRDALFTMPRNIIPLTLTFRTNNDVYKRFLTDHSGPIENIELHCDANDLEERRGVPRNTYITNFNARHTFNPSFKVFINEVMKCEELVSLSLIFKNNHNFEEFFQNIKSTSLKSLVIIIEHRTGSVNRDLDGFISEIKEALIFSALPALDKLVLLVKKRGYQELKYTSTPIDLESDGERELDGE